MNIKQVKARKVFDMQFPELDEIIINHVDYDDLISNPKFKKGWLSITSLVHHKASDDIYVGTSSLCGEILWKLDRKTGEITSCGYEKICDKYDAKFHRALEIDGDSIYGGIALFHDVDKQFDAKGGRIIRYDIPSESFEILGIPMERIYIQAFAHDPKRGKLYGYGAVPEVFWEFDIEQKKITFMAYIGSGIEFAGAHNPCLDKDGNVWFTYGITRAFAYQTGPDAIRIMKYDPSDKTITFFKHGFPTYGGPGKGRPDNMLLGPDGMIYVGTTDGVLARLDPATGDVEDLGSPVGKPRLGGFAFHPDNGLLYGISGEGDGTVELFCYDTAKKQYLWHEPIEDSDGERPVRIHHMIITPDGTIYAGENDNGTRSSHVWEIKI